MIAISGFAQAHLPVINQQIVAFCKANEGKKIDRGECWDLAVFALNSANANWKPPFDFGTKYDFRKDSIFAGDIIQFENVEFKGENYSMTMPHHTAIVLEVLADKKCLIAHQNFAGKRKVQFPEVNFADVKKGSLQFYRPISK
jgi:hypothetical protein